MWRVAVWVLLSAIMTVQVRGQTAQRALLPVKVNETDRGEVFAYIDGDDILIAREFLQELQIPLDAASVRTIEDGTFVSLRSLAPKITFKFDPAEVVLAITADPSLLGTRVLSLNRVAAAEDRGGDPSIFLNYAVSGQRLSTPGVFTEIGANRDHRFVYSGLSRSATGDIVRGLSYFNYEWPERLRRLTVGDSFAGSNLLGGTVLMGGVTLSRQFSLQPYLIRTPTLDVTGAATTPSTVEVYVNGQLTNRLQVEPGVFTLRDLPATGGLGNTRLVIRDAFGRETVQQSSFYYTNVALRRGLSDYIFSVGKIRNDLSKSFEYEEMAGLAQYRKGITDTLTVGGRGEVSEEVVSGGPSVTLATRFGDIDTQVAASRSNGETGTAGSLAYRFTTPRYSFGFSTVQRSSQYATLSLASGEDRPVRDSALFVATNIGRLNLGLTGTRTDLRDGQQFETYALQANAPISRWGNLFTSFGASSVGGDFEPEVIVGLTVGLSGYSTVNVQFQRAQGENGARAEIRKPLGYNNGYGFSLSTDTITDQRFGTLQYQTSFGRYEISADPTNAENATYNLAGGVVFLGGTTRASRPIEEGFALARVGVPGVQIFASNQPIGRTNSAGDLLVGNLLAHYNNELRISDKDIPIDYEITGTKVIVVPPTHGGVIANFPVRRLRSYTGTMSFMIVGQPYKPALGEVVVNRPGAKATVLPLGRSGEFYVEDLDPGSYNARLRIGKVQCEFSLVLPQTNDALTDLGVIPCAP